MNALTISKAAREAGVGVETVRFYERQGLIEQPPKPLGLGVRTYSPDMVARIRFIKEAQQIGFSLREITELLTLRADPAADCSDVREQATAKLKEVRQKIERLREIGTALETLIAACPGRGGLQACSIMDALTQRSCGHVAADRPRHSKRANATEHQMKTTTFKIEGMHCDGCALTVKTLVEKEPGVKAVMVSFKESEARVLYDSKATSEDRLVATIQRPGYRVVGCQ